MCDNDDAGVDAEDADGDDADGGVEYEDEDDVHMGPSHLLVVATGRGPKI